MSTVLEEISTIEPDKWARDLVREKEVPSFSGQSMFCFKRYAEDGLDAHLWITERKQHQFYVSNIVPIEVSQLSIDDYNDVLMEFFDLGIKDIVEGLGGIVELTTDEYHIEDELGQECAQKLRKFSSAANKSTGNTHPLDQERWFDFIVSAFNYKNQIDPSDIEKFLVQDGWSEDFAIELACQFSQSINLLEFYETK